MIWLMSISSLADFPIDYLEEKRKVYWSTTEHSCKTCKYDTGNVLPDNEHYLWHCTKEWGGCIQARHHFWSRQTDVNENTATMMTVGVESLSSNRKPEATEAK